MQAFSLSRDDLFFYSSLSKITPEIEEKVFCIQKGEGRVEVNFSNIFREAFTNTDPKSVKRQSSHHSLFAILGSVLVKAARKMLVKLTPGWSKFHQASQSPNAPTRT